MSLSKAGAFDLAIRCSACRCPDIVPVLSASLGSGSDGTMKVEDGKEGGVKISVVGFREWL